RSGAATAAATGSLATASLAGGVTRSSTITGAGSADAGAAAGMGPGAGRAQAPERAMAVSSEQARDIFDMGLCLAPRSVESHALSTRIQVSTVPSDRSRCALPAGPSGGWVPLLALFSVPSVPSVRSEACARPTAHVEGEPAR